MESSIPRKFRFHKSIKMANEIERYKSLDIRNSLSSPYRYPFACKEVGVIIRFCYTKLPKPLQSLIFDDTIFAFRLLPQMQTQSAVSAATGLIQSAESAFPKLKRVLAAIEFKQAMIAYKRGAKIHKDDKETVCLPQDVLVHLFCFLDVQSLLTAGLVCWMWNAAANDNYLWQLQYNNYFGNSESNLKTQQHVSTSELCSNANKGRKDDSRKPRLWRFQYHHFDCSENILKFGKFPDGETTEGKQDAPLITTLETDANQRWKYDFKKAYLGLPNKFDRSFCLYCKSVVWLNNLKCPNQCRGQNAKEHRLQPLSPSEIGRYIMGDLHVPWLWYSHNCDEDTDDSNVESDEDLYSIPSYRIWGRC